MNHGNLGLLNYIPTKNIKRDLLQDIDKAIEIAPDEEGGYPLYQKAPKYGGFDQEAAIEEYTERVREYETIQFQACGSTYTIINTKPRLKNFRERIQRDFPDKPLNRPAVLPTMRPGAPSRSNRIRGPVSYYNPFKAKINNIKPKPEPNEVVIIDKEKRWLSDGSYIVLLKDASSVKNREVVERSIESIWPKPDETIAPCTHLAEFFLGSADLTDHLHHFPVKVHAVSSPSNHEIYQARYFDRILTLWPKAQIFMLEERERSHGPAFFKFGNNFVGAVMPLQVDENTWEFVRANFKE